MKKKARMVLICGSAYLLLVLVFVLQLKGCVAYFILVSHSIKIIMVSISSQLLHTCSDDAVMLHTCSDDAVMLHTCSGDTVMLQA